MAVKFPLQQQIDSTLEYIDSQDGKMLASANKYSNTVGTDTLVAANAYTDEHAGGVTQEYVDEGDASTLEKAAQYIDEAVAQGMPVEGWNKVYSNADTTAMVVGQRLVFGAEIPARASDILITAMPTAARQQNNVSVLIPGGSWFVPSETQTNSNTFKVVTTDGNVNSYVISGYFDTYGSVVLTEFTGNSFLTGVYYRLNNKAILIDGDADVIDKVIEDQVTATILDNTEGWTLLWDGDATNTTSVYTLYEPITNYDEIMICSNENEFHSGLSSTIVPVAGYQPFAGPVDRGTMWTSVNVPIIGYQGTLYQTQMTFLTASTFQMKTATSTQEVNAIYGRKARVVVQVPDVPAPVGLSWPDWSYVIKTISQPANWGVTTSTDWHNAATDLTESIEENCWATISVHMPQPYQPAASALADAHAYVVVNSTLVQHGMAQIVAYAPQDSGLTFGPFPLKAYDTLVLCTSKTAAVGYSFGTWEVRLFGLR